MNKDFTYSFRSFVGSNFMFNFPITLCTPEYYGTTLILERPVVE